MDLHGYMEMDVDDEDAFKCINPNFIHLHENEDDAEFATPSPSSGFYSQNSGVHSPRDDLHSSMSPIPEIVKLRGSFDPIPKKVVTFGTSMRSSGT